MCVCVYMYICVDVCVCIYNVLSMLQIVSFMPNTAYIKYALVFLGLHNFHFYTHFI